MLLCYRFHYDDLPLRKILIQKFTSVLQKHNIKTYMEHKEESPTLNLVSIIDPIESLNENFNLSQPSTSGEKLTSKDVFIVPPNVYDNESN